MLPPLVPFGVDRLTGILLYVLAQLRIAGYSLMLGLLALVGFLRSRLGVTIFRSSQRGSSSCSGQQVTVPALFLHSFPSWFVGVAFAAIGIGALVPAAIMSIAAANLYTRNIHRGFSIGIRATNKRRRWRSGCRSSSRSARWCSFFCPHEIRHSAAATGGIWIIQTLPSVMLGVYTRWFNSWALLVGWAVGTVAGTAMAIAANLAPAYPLAIGGYQFAGLHRFLHAHPKLSLGCHTHAGIQCPR